jgi:hypothetical protein
MAAIDCGGEAVLPVEGRGAVECVGAAVGCTRVGWEAGVCCSDGGGGGGGRRGLIDALPTLIGT